MESYQDNLEDMKNETTLKIIQGKYEKLKRYSVGLYYTSDLITEKKLQ